MSEEEQEAKRKELRTQASAYREDVWQALADFYRVFKASQEAFRPVAHELRELGDSPKPLSPKWVALTASRYARRNTKDPVNL